MFIRETEAIDGTGTLLVFDCSASVFDVFDLVREVRPDALIACAGQYENAIFLPNAEAEHA